jgi:hypothetical protein
MRESLVAPELPEGPRVRFDPGSYGGACDFDIKLSLYGRERFLERLINSLRLLEFVALRLEFLNRLAIRLAQTDNFRLQDHNAPFKLELSRPVA